jgi:hypothetical protein
MSLNTNEKLELIQVEFVTLENSCVGLVHPQPYYLTRSHRCVYICLVYISVDDPTVQSQARRVPSPGFFRYFSSNYSTFFKF